ASGVAAVRAGGATRMRMTGRQPVTVPGVVAGWAAVAGLGARLSWAQRLAPAIGLARDGAPGSPGLARAMGERTDVIAAAPGLSALLTGLTEGDRLVQPELAASLEALAVNWHTF